ncbi:hypothetical protein GN244_ATG18971 [Phytophthora infestans]|uniref:Uncharacterized protein n=1 Tax=Phytophthora infestans TaxID=4787 RepID=A0A833WJG4_PHYIN|nr:hypothetical protein GN244_ATG18971 [Phytophthora infestans]
MYSSLRPQRFHHIHNFVRDLLQLALGLVGAVDQVVLSLQGVCKLKATHNNRNDSYDSSTYHNAFRDRPAVTNRKLAGCSDNANGDAKLGELIN